MRKPEFRWSRFAGLLMLALISATSSSANALEILTVCDSITQGFQRTANKQVYGITSPVNGAANIGGYQPRLKAMLDANIEPSNVYNWGIGGENSSKTANRIESVLDSRPADYILILCGANDLYQGISDDANQANIEFMVQQSLARGVIPVVAEMTPNTVSYNFDHAIQDNYNPHIRQVAAQYDVPLAWLYGKDNTYDASSWANDMRKCWKGGPGCVEPLTSGDQLHVSDYGYDVMTQIWFDTIAEHHGDKNINIIPILELLLLSDV